MPTTLSPESWEAFCKRVARSEAPIAWAWAAVRDDGGEWQLGALGVRAGNEPEPRVLRYRDAVIRTESVSPRTAASRLRRHILGAPRHWAQRLILPPIAERVRGSWYFSGDQVYMARGGWPQFALYTGFGGERRTSFAAHTPLSAPGLPYFPSLSTAVAAEVFGSDRTSFRTSRRPCWS